MVYVVLFPLNSGKGEKATPIRFEPGAGGVIDNTTNFRRFIKIRHYLIYSYLTVEIQNGM